MHHDAMGGRPGLRRSGPASLVPILLLALTTACTSPALPSPAGSPSRAPGPTGDGGHTFPALEARMPVHAGGRILQTASARPDPGLQDAKTLQVLERLGKTPADIELASASLAGVDVTVGALRIVGSDAQVAMATFREVDEADPGHQAVYGEATMAGHAVITRTVGQRPEYIYPLEDIMFVVQGAPELVDEVLRQLP